MGLRFRRTIKIAPGVRLNFGKNGVSTSVGKRGAGVTFGQNGTTAHVGIPGTGMSYTTKISSKKKSTTQHSQKTSQPKSSCCCSNSCLGLFVAAIIIGTIGNAYDKYGSTPFLYIGGGIVALLLLLFITSKLITVIRKMMNPVEYVQDKIATGSLNANKQENPNEVVSLEVNENENNSNEYKNSNIRSQIENENVIKAISSTGEAAAEVAFKLRALDHTPINPREPFTNWKFPSVNLLKKYPYDDSTNMCGSKEDIENNKNKLIQVLNGFDIQICSIKVTVGPTVSLYEVTLEPGITLSQIRSYEDDIALSLGAIGIRTIVPIPGKGTIGIEIPNEHPNIVSMWSILNSRKFEETKMELPIVLGKTVANDIFMVDLAKIPHLLIAGTTGHGKSAVVEAMIISLLYKKHPNELKLVLIDPKKIEFNIFAPIAKHYMAALEVCEDEPIITDYDKAIKTLRGLCALMDHRYDMLKLAQTRNIVEYNKKFIDHRLNPAEGHKYMPYIVIVIDEFGDLMMAKGDEFEKPTTRIAQLARAVGIHIVMATQYPSSKIITDTIKREFPGRIAYKVGSRIDSLVILDRTGAQQLTGRGDMLYSNGSEPTRIQSAFIDFPEIEAISRFIAEQPGPVMPLLIPDPNTCNSNSDNEKGIDVRYIDPLFEQAARMVVLSQQCSTSKIQRNFLIGYNRAGRLMDQLEQAGIVGEAKGSATREVLISDERTLNTLFTKLKID